MKARDLMTPSPVTVGPQASLAEVWDLMREVEIRHIPVVQGGALVGMVSDRDLARLDVHRLLEVEGADALRRELATPVVDVMSSEVTVVEPETQLSDIVGVLVGTKVGALPVVEPSGEVVGIVSYIDVLQALQDGLERISAYQKSAAEWREAGSQPAPRTDSETPPNA
jgi:acetoin utilization protein AcuB